jgi:hypothetical protein
MTRLLLVKDEDGAPVAPPLVLQVVADDQAPLALLVQVCCPMTLAAKIKVDKNMISFFIVVVSSLSNIFSDYG